MSKKKVNPRRIPLSKAALEQAKKYARAEAIDFLYCISMMVLKDDFGFSADELKYYFDRMEYHGDSIAKGYASIQDYRQMLKDEADIVIKPEFYPAGNHG